MLVYDVGGCGLYDSFIFPMEPSIMSFVASDSGSGCGSAEIHTRTRYLRTRLYSY